MVYIHKYITYIYVYSMCIHMVCVYILTQSSLLGYTPYASVYIHTYICIHRDIHKNVILWCAVNTELFSWMYAICICIYIYTYIHMYTVFYGLYKQEKSSVFTTDPNMMFLCISICIYIYVCIYTDAYGVHPRKELCVHKSSQYDVLMYFYM